MTKSINTSIKQLVELLDQQTDTNGVHESGIDGVKLVRIECPTPKFNIIYKPSIVFVVQGSKKGFLGQEVFNYNAESYMILTVPLPFETQVIEASPEAPLLALDIDIDPKALASLLTDMDIELQTPAKTVPCSTQSTPLTEDLVEAATRLLRCTLDPDDCKILGPQIKREILYRILCGEQGESLRGLINRDSKFGRIANAVDFIHAQYGEPMDVDTMAKAANMSVSAFHQHFKKVTSFAPLQYVKSIRLHKARELMVEEGLNVNLVSEKVGYNSIPQFSREFKKFFGVNPSIFTSA